MHFLKCRMDWVRTALQAALDKMKGLSFWISVQVRYTHPTREVKDMKPQYLHTGKRSLMNHEELEQKLDAMVGTILLHNAHFLSQSSGLVLADMLTFRFKVCEFLPLVGREFQQLPTFLAKKKANVNVKNNDSRCFGYAIASALAKLKKNRATAELEPALPHLQAGLNPIPRRGRRPPRHRRQFGGWDQHLLLLRLRGEGALPTLCNKEGV